MNFLGLALWYYCIPIYSTQHCMKKTHNLTGLNSIGLCQAKAITQLRIAEFGTQTLSICLIQDNI